jgi:galactokinase/mevalonate kinase-like predicted kinase
VQPVVWSEERQAEFGERMVLYNTGIQRMAKGLLRQVVSRYLARETATIQVLHSIKTLAVEMAYAMAEGDWVHLGELLDRHWQLNQVLDPHTTNAPINAILDRARPYIHGAKLAGAGGGGFLMLLARDAEAAYALRAALTQEAPEGGAFVPYRLADEGLRVQTAGEMPLGEMPAGVGRNASCAAAED